MITLNKMAKFFESGSETVNARPSSVPWLHIFNATFTTKNYHRGESPDVSQGTDHLSPITRSVTNAQLSTVTTTTSSTTKQTDKAMLSKLTYDDVVVFSCLESLALLAIIGNLALLIVITKFKYLNKASFVLMFNLALADIMHGFVTSSYFYPPILLKMNHMPYIGVKIYNVIDWTAWSITITHMSAISIDRLIAILLFGRYNSIVTTRRIRLFSISCWCLFGATNLLFFVTNLCCLIVPQSDLDYYTFDFNPPTDGNGTVLDHFNIYPKIYMPLEVLTLIILFVCNPITLVQLYRRHKRKMAMRRASAMLLAMSQTMTRNLGSHGLSLEEASKTRDSAARRANRQQQRVFVQITTVAIIFFCYMFVYYLFFYVAEIGAKWAVLCNSFFYSTTHMINPVVYFGLNAEMRSQLISLLSCCLPKCATKPKSRTPKAGKNNTTNPTGLMACAAKAKKDRGTESSPLLGAVMNYRAKEEAGGGLKPNAHSHLSLSKSAERILANNIASKSTSPLLDHTSISSKLPSEEPKSEENESQGPAMGTTVAEISSSGGKTTSADMETASSSVYFTANHHALENTEELQKAHNKNAPARLIENCGANSPIQAHCGAEKPVLVSGNPESDAGENTSYKISTSNSEGKKFSTITPSINNNPAVPKSTSSHEVVKRKRLWSNYSQGNQRDGSFYSLSKIHDQLCKKPSSVSEKLSSYSERFSSFTDLDILNSDRTSIYANCANVLSGANSCDDLVYL